MPDRAKEMSNNKEYNLRNIPYPTLHPAVGIWVSSFASCAIEGNKLGIHMMALWNSDDESRKQFLIELEDWLNEEIHWTGAEWTRG